MNKQLLLLCILLSVLLAACREAEVRLPAQRQGARAQLAVPPEGLQKATITTSVGRFERDVMLKGGDVECIQWSKHRCTPFKGKFSENGSASGIMQNGELVRIELAMR